MARIGLIGGSGLDHWGEPQRRLDASTPFGAPSGALEQFEVAGHQLLFLPRHGRRHRIAPHRINYRANLHALYEHGVEAVIAVNAVGSLDRSLEPGALVVPDQLIDYTWGRAHSFLDGEAAPLDHAEFTNPFSDEWRRRLLAAVSTGNGAPRDGACLGVTQGPRLETAAEIRRLARDGCDLVGMTSLPEAALAREVRLEYACLAAVANFAAGIDDGIIAMADMERALDPAMEQVRQLLHAMLEAL